MPVLRINGAEFNYELRGSGPAIVFLHAGIADMHMWDAQIEDFASRYQVLCYDQRGFGNTVNNDDSFSYVEDLRAILDRLGIAKTSVIGCSLGGMVAVEFAALYAQRVAKLVLVGSSIAGHEPTAPQPPQWMAARKAFERGDYDTVAELAVQVFVDGRGRSGDKVAPSLREYVRVNYLASLPKGTQPPREHWPDPPALTRLEQISIPTLVIVGSLDTEQVIESCELLARRIPDARKVHIEDCAHLPNMEKPEAFNAILRDFIEG